jgi:2-polyprenyl-3-methyl-5-hydroxy-6-metoxy-1,4-benzoquinol methylase
MSIANLNSFGNFTCSVWTKDGITIGNEEGLNGRSHLILSEIKKKIIEKFSEEEITKKTIIDIGCYDGFYLTELSKLKFKKIIGLEPKKKNIIKGKEIRKFLKIEEPNIDFIEGNLSTFPTNNKFDIVLCLGVLHHVPDHHEFLKKLINITSEMLFLDSRVVQNKLVDKKNFLSKIEMLDVIYKFKKKSVSFSVHKYESSFNDTSTDDTGIVSIPSEETIEIFLDSLNFKTTTLISPKNYRKKLNHKRDLDGILVYAEPKKNANKNYSLTYAMLYEKKLFNENFTGNFIESLYKIAYSKNKFILIFQKNFFIYILLKYKLFFIFDFFFKKKFNKNKIEILKNLHYSFNDKITYELSKYYYFTNNFEQAYELSNKLTNKLNADFRSVYRSFYLLYKIANKINLDKKKFAEYYLRLFFGKL